MPSHNRFSPLIEHTERQAKSEMAEEYIPYVPHMKASYGFEIVMNKKERRAVKNKILPTEKDLRADAHEIINDRCRLHHRLRNTRMCMYALAGKECPRREGACRFAHSEEELVPPPCVFRDACRKMWTETDRCMCIHPRERVEDYEERTKNFRDLDIMILH